MQKTKHSKRFWLALVVFSLVGQVAWVVENMYFNVFIYETFRASASDIALMVGASSVSATVTTLLIGALSDKVGKRKLFICSGYILWGISIWCFAFLNEGTVHALFPAAVSAAAVGVSLTVILDCVMTFFGSAANDACFNAWLTDSTDETNRGAAEGINSMMPLVAILVVFGGFMFLPAQMPGRWSVIFGIIGSVVLLLGVAGIFLIKEPPVRREGNENYFKNIFYGFRPKVIAGNSRLYITLVAYAIFGISINTFMPYLILYFEKTLQMADYVVVFAPAVVLAAAFTAFYGRVYDRFGFRTAVLPALGLLMAGYILLYLFQSRVLLFLGTLLMMCGYLSGMAVFGAMLRDRTPQGKAGMFQGQRIVGQVLIPGIVGPAIGEFVLRNADKIVNTDGTESFLPNQNIFLAALLGLVVIFAVLIPLFHLLKKEKNHD